MKSTGILLVSLMLSINTCFAQQGDAKDSTSVFLGVQGNAGKILAHSRSIADLARGLIGGFQADISRVRYTTASWSTCNCYSRNGIALSYIGFGNPRELGSSYSLALFAEPRLTYGTLWFSLRAAAGISYLDRVYHPDDNPRNLFFSSPWSGLLSLQLSGRYPLSAYWAIVTGGSYQHISNGGNRQPNKGMNFVTVNLGVEYTTKYVRIPRRQKIRHDDKSLRYYLGLTYNTRSVDESSFSSRERKAVLGLQGGAYKPLSRMHAFGIGLEAFQDNALKEQALRRHESFDHRVVSVLARHHFLFGRFDFSQALGFYLYKQYATPDNVFQRYAIYYAFFEKLQAGFSLKAHRYVAEQMDVRVGILL